VPIASKLSQYLLQHGIDCQPIHHPRGSKFEQALELSGAVPELTLKAIVLLDQKGPVMAVIPYLADLDLPLVNQTLSRQLQILSGKQAGQLFKDCEPENIPALGMAYGLPILIESEALEYDHCFMRSGCSSTMLRLSGRALRTAMKGAIKVNACVWPEVLEKTLGTGVNACRGNLSLEGVAKKLQQVYRLPPMPETAVRIMHMTSDPDSDVFQLAGIVERDPSLSAQIMRYARSALFSYRGDLTSIKDAINIVLGFDRVSKLAMGIAAAKAFSISENGPLGLQNFWQHALYSGVLCQALALMSGPELHMDDKDAYLNGLLHNFGILLIGHLFPPEFKMLNKLRESEPDSSMQEIEQQVFGMGEAQQFIALGHGSMGAILLKMWGMPESTVKVAAMHQNFAYEGEYQAEVKLVQLSNFLLAQYGIGDEPMDVDTGELFAALGIDEDKAFALAELTVDQCRSLDGIAAQMVA